MTNFIEELSWRGMIHTIMPGTEELLSKGKATAYVGIDPTADSLHIGHLVSIMMLKHFQLAGHRPIALIGGATGMIGDPSGKSEERNLLNEEILRHNQDCLQKQLAKFLDFEHKENGAKIVNNYDWMKNFSFLEFIRDIGKHITISYMTAKDSVQKRLETGLSFTEFSYQLVQGYDFLYLFENENCKLQMGGSDQWGNITTGSELIRRKLGGEAFALTCPLITKSDGSKFGKTESGNIWLDPEKTSPYTFYQFWLNVSDEDAVKYIKIFTTRTKENIEELEKEHLNAPHLRLVQKELAKDLTILIHSEEDYNMVVEASNVLFGSGNKDSLNNISEKILLSVFEQVPKTIINKADFGSEINILDFLVDKTNIVESKSEARRLLKSNGISINKEKIQENKTINNSDLLQNKYIFVQKGKKNYYLVVIE